MTRQVIMGDFERTFGAGANLDSIIDGYSREYRREQSGSGGFSMPKPKHVAQKAVGWDSVNGMNYDKDYKISDANTLCGPSGNGTLDLVFVRANTNS